jgi:hypothetical protein
LDEKWMKIIEKLEEKGGYWEECKVLSMKERK